MRDGDTKTHLTLCKAEPYDAGVPIVKHQCVGHVQKRMGKQLRDLQKNKLQVEVVDIAATKRKYAKEQREASLGKAAGRSRRTGMGRGRGRGRGMGSGMGSASASGPVEPPLTPKEAIPPKGDFLTFSVLI